MRAFLASRVIMTKAITRLGSINRIRITDNVQPMLHALPTKWARVRKVKSMKAKGGMKKISRSTFSIVCIVVSKILVIGSAVYDEK